MHARRSIPSGASLNPSSSERLIFAIMAFAASGGLRPSRRANLVNGLADESGAGIEPTVAVARW